MHNFEEIINKQDTYNIDYIRWDRCEWEVEDLRYFIEFSPATDYEEYKSYSIRFGLIGDKNPYKEIERYSLDVVLKIVRTLGVCVTTFAHNNKVRYLFYATEGTPKERAERVKDPVRSRLFVRWKDQNYPQGSVFKIGRRVGIDFQFLFHENEKLQKGRPYHESWSRKCYRLNPYLKSLIIPYSLELKFHVVEVEVAPGKYVHKLYCFCNEFLLKSGLEGFYLQKGGSIYPFETGEELRDILLKCKNSNGL
jgi:hypothetical protein